ncbi:hypothetical protein LNO78_29075 [Klebsiella pneumoniae subsp. pneumoniae]|nr:hypothetical protein [Klebsiella pneumoniae subsp. pneumoniae]
METKLIIVGGTKGGPGKSTVAQQVAAGLQLKRGKKGSHYRHRHPADDNLMVRKSAAIIKISISSPFLTLRMTL